MRYLKTSIAVCVGLVIALPVLADTFVRTANQFELPQNQIIEGNFLGVGNPISLAGEVTEDATLVGNRVTVTGTIGQDLLAFGILAGMDGTVLDDVRIVAGNTTISGTIAGDLLLVGGTVDILSDAVIEGDLVVYSGTVNISGTVGGDIIGAAQTIAVDGPVGGAIDVRVTQLILGANASVTESVRYKSSSLLSQSPNTIIGGTVMRNDLVYTAGGFSLTAALYPVLILLFSTFVWYVLSKKTMERLVRQTMTVLPRSAITGVISFFVAPLIIFVLTVSLLGGYLWVADMSSGNSAFVFSIALLPVLVVLFGFLTMCLMAIIAVPALFGQMCMYVSKSMKDELSPMSILIGALVCVILLLLPVIGVFIFLFASVILLGGLLEGLIRASR